MNMANKHLVFYSERSGFYKYFAGTIAYLLEHGSGVIHYITNDPNDRIFDLAEQEPRIHPYYISEKKCITAFMKMDCDIFVSTLEDLDNYYLKRSRVRDDVEYVFTFHHMTSTHLTANPHAYDHNDTIFCVGPHQVAELRRAEELYGLPARNLVEVGYTLLDENIASYEAMYGKDAAKTESAEGEGDGTAAAKASELPAVLIGPSWQEDNLLDSCLDPMLESLGAQDLRTIVRPHPEYVKRYKARWNAIKERWAQRSDGAAALAEGRLEFQDDFSRNDTVFTSDVLITDWSSIAYEFSFSTTKPCIFIDTPMKLGNPNWEEFGLPATDLTLREQIGVSLAPEDAHDVGAKAAELIAHANDWSQTIDTIRHESVFNLGHAAEVSGEYLLQDLLGRTGRKPSTGENAGQGDTKDENAESETAASTSEEVDA